MIMFPMILSIALCTGLRPKDIPKGIPPLSSIMGSIEKKITNNSLFISSNISSISIPPLAITTLYTLNLTIGNGN